MNKTEFFDHQDVKNLMLEPFFPSQSTNAIDLSFYRRCLRHTALKLRILLTSRSAKRYSIICRRGIDGSAVKLALHRDIWTLLRVWVVTEKHSYGFGHMALCCNSSNISCARDKTEVFPFPRSIMAFHCLDRTTYIDALYHVARLYQGETSIQTSRYHIICD